MAKLNTMPERKTVAGVILAGGLARRMNGRDKGLIHFRGRPLLCHAIDALAGVTADITINANRNLEHYLAFGYPVVSDMTDSFDGPLAGILTALEHTHADLLVVMPCDSPNFTRKHLQKLLAAVFESDADVAVAVDDQRLHSVFLALRTGLKDSLQDYLARGERKVEAWLRCHRLVEVDFRRTPEIFANVNTMTELNALEAQGDE